MEKVNGGKCNRGFTIIAALLLSVSLITCGGGGDDDPDDPLVPPNSITVSGVVKSSEDGEVLEGVTVASSDGISINTDTNGLFSLSVPLENDRGALSFSKSGYAENSRIILDGSDVSSLTVLLLPVTQSFEVDPSVANTLTIEDSVAGISLPAGGLLNVQRAIVSGNVTVDLTSINPLQNPETMPGDFTAADGSGDVSIESFGALNVLIRDSSNEPVNLAAGQVSTVRIAVPAGSDTPPATIPLYYFDAEEGRWIEEGTATLKGTAPDQYYEGTVSHFSTWNADRPYDRATITGIVNDSNGTPVEGAIVTAVGQDYTGTTTARTNSEGAFSVFAKALSSVMVSATKDGQGSNTVVTTTEAAGQTTELEDPLIIGLDSSVTIKLTWAADPRDLDTHLTGPKENSTNRFHIYFGSKGYLTAEPFAKLDVDDVDGYGPEITTITRLIPGTYRYSVYHYAGSSTIGASSARVEANFNGNIRIFNPPASALGGGARWTVFEFVVDSSGTIQAVTPINTITTNAAYNITRSVSRKKAPMTPEQESEF